MLDRLKVMLPKFDAPVALMSGGQRQAIAVARATVFARKVVILDEPTAALGLRESRQVLDLVAQLRDEGNAVILITHNMEQVVELADRAVVLRQGRKVGELKPERANQQELVSMIVGQRGSEGLAVRRSAKQRIASFRSDLHREDRHATKTTHCGGLALAAAICRTCRWPPTRSRSASSRSSRCRSSPPWRTPPRRTRRPIPTSRSSSARARRPPTSRARSR